MKEALKIIRGLSFSMALVICAFSLVAMIVRGRLWASVRLMPIAFAFAELTLAFCLAVILPMTIFRSTRGIAGVALSIAAYIFGTTLWITALLYTAVLWGVFGVVLGLGFVGIGMIGTALFATLFHGEWTALLTLGTLLFLTWISHVGGLYAILKHQQGINSKAPTEKPPQVRAERRAA